MTRVRGRLPAGKGEPGRRRLPAVSARAYRGVVEGQLGLYLRAHPDVTMEPPRGGRIWAWKQDEPDPLTGTLVSGRTEADLLDELVRLEAS